MSFILDALKKSENERQRRREPTLADIPYGRSRPSQAVWIGVVVALLVANLGVLAYVLWPKSATESSPAPAAAPVSAPTVAPATATAPLAPVSAPPAEVRPLSAEAQSAKEPEEEPQEPAEENSSVSSEPKLVRAIGAPPPAAALSSADLANAPTLSSLGGAGALNLPELHLDIHVYSAVPAERFVFINMRKYTEGQALAEGPTVQRIAGDGVVLEYRNQRFLLSRQ